MKKFEYKVAILYNDSDSLVIELNNYGLKGWELVSFSYLNLMAIFKREIV